MIDLFSLLHGFISGEQIIQSYDVVINSILARKELMNYLCGYVSRFLRFFLEWRRWDGEKWLILNHPHSPSTHYVKIYSKNSFFLITKFSTTEIGKSKSVLSDFSSFLAGFHSRKPVYWNEMELVKQGLGSIKIGSTLFLASFIKHCLHLLRKSNFWVLLWNNFWTTSGSWYCIISLFRIWYLHSLGKSFLPKNIVSKLSKEYLWSIYQKINCLCFLKGMLQ